MYVLSSSFKDALASVKSVDVGHHGCPTCNQEVETAPQFLQPQTASGNKPIKWQHF